MKDKASKESGSQDKPKEETPEEKRRKEVIKYVIPYSLVDLKKMAVFFNVEVAEIESEVASLILDEKIKGVIDSHNKVLVLQNINKRKEVFEKITNMAEIYERTSKLLALRFALLKNRIEIKLPGIKMRV